MICEDFVMLGKTVPEPASDGRVFVCSAGISRELGLIRIYPLARRGAPPRWSMSTIALTRNPKDNRAESWQIAGDRHEDEHPAINDRFRIFGEVPRQDRPGLLRPRAATGIKALNGLRSSLAVVHPAGETDLYFDYNPDSPDSPQLALFDHGETKPTAGARRFAFIPRLRFTDVDGDQHDLMLRDWGAYEFLRKYGDDRRHDLAGALHLDASASLLIGNFNRHRNAWCVISVLRGLRPQTALFGLLELEGVA